MMRRRSTSTPRNAAKSLIVISALAVVLSSVTDTCEELGAVTDALGVTMFLV